MIWTETSKVIIQGITEPLALEYGEKMKKYGTNIVGGISAGFGGQVVKDIPIFDLVDTAISEIGEIEIAVNFSPYKEVLDTALEAMAAGIKQIIIVANGVPPLDTIKLLKKATINNTLIIGPGSSGIIIPNKIWIGICQPQFYQEGKVGLISLTDSINYEVALQLNRCGLGESIVINLGNEGIIGSDFKQWLEILDRDIQTEVIVLILPPQSNQEKDLADFIATEIKKPVIIYLPGEKTPIQRIVKDTNTIIANQLSYFLENQLQNRDIINIFNHAKINIALSPSEIPNIVKNCIK